MCVRTAEAKGADRGLPALRSFDAPLLQLVVDVERTGCQIDVLVQSLEVDAGRKLPMPKREHDFDKAGDACRRHAVTDIAFHGSERAEGRLSRVLAESVLE